MTNRNMQLFQRDSYGVTYADPLNPSTTVRFKQKRSRKVLQGVVLDNFHTEIIDNGIAKVDGLCATGSCINEPYSVRFSVSGSQYAMPAIAARLRVHADLLEQWYTENVFTGFDPATVPYVQED